MSAYEAEHLPQGRDEEAADWCMRLAEHALEPEEQRAFDQWVADPANRSAFDDALGIWQAAEVAAEIPELITIRGEALEAYRRANRNRWTSRLPSRWRLPLSIAAALLLAVITALYMLNGSVQVYETGVGERRIAMLDDGSRLSLDGDTRIEVRLRGDHRDLRLIEGRAKFDVAKDPLRPFSVRADDKLVVATGTSFSVELLSRQVRVLLYEGRVAVLDRGRGFAKPRPLTLKAGTSPAEKALVPGRELVTDIGAPVAAVENADMARSLAWENGQLSFDNEPLSTALQRVNRYAATKIEVGDRAIDNIRINGVFTSGDIDAFLEGVTAYNDIEIVRQSDHLLLKSR